MFLKGFSVSQGSIISTIGSAINAVISAIAAVIETIVGAIVAVRTVCYQVL
jgi:phage-related protein